MSPPTAWRTILRGEEPRTHLRNQTWRRGLRRETWKTAQPGQELNRAVNRCGVTLLARVQRDSTDSSCCASKQSGDGLFKIRRSDAHDHTDGSGADPQSHTATNEYACTHAAVGHACVGVPDAISDRPRPDDDAYEDTDSGPSGLSYRADAIAALPGIQVHEQNAGVLD